MEEFVCITIRSQPGENESDFSARLSVFWTHMLRTRPDDFEMVYAETTAFEPDGNRLTRKYLAAEEVIDVLEAQMANAGVEYAPIDRDDLYSKYEATPPEWMQIEH